MYVKICGLREPAHAVLAAELGADAVGVVMSPGSRRHASADEARAVVSAARSARPGIDTVLVVNTIAADTAAQLALDLGFDVLQLHGLYTADDVASAQALLPRVWRATSLTEAPRLYAGELSEERLLLDGATPGSGDTWDLSPLGRDVELRRRIGHEWLLAGGLSPENVAASISIARPGGVDVSSGVEHSPGQKHPDLIRRFIAAARAERALRDESDVSHE